MFSTHSRFSYVRTSRQGFSLIEVAIALVIFVIGALAIIRIFPGALSVIGNNGDQQLATNMNRSTLTSLQSEQVVPTPVPTPGPTPVPTPGVAARLAFNAVPGATFNNSNAGGTLSILSWTGTGTTNHSRDFRDTDSSVIGIPRFNNTLPRTDEIETDSSSSALSRYRAVVGEKAPITPLTIGLSTDNYALTQFPISVQGAPPAPVPVPVQVVVSQDVVLDDVRVQPDGTLNFSQARVDGSNNIAATIAVNSSSMLYVSYRYLNSSNVTWGIREEAVTIPATVNDLKVSTTIRVRPPLTGRRDSARTNSSVVDGVVPEIVQVSLRKYVGQGDFVGPTPIGQVADARRGLVRLPTGLDFTKPVVLDYVADWSFLMQDGVPLITPSASYPPPALPPDLNYRQLALGAPYIEDRVPISVYSLLIESGTAYKSGYGTDPSASVQNVNDRLVRPIEESAREDELRAGKVTFIVENNAARARAAYKTRDNWVQQLSVAALSYKPFVVGGVTAGSRSIEPWRDYYLGDDNYLYFHASEAGKTISISYTLFDGVDRRSFVDRPFVIESTLINAGNLVPIGFIQNYAGSAGSVPQIARVQLTNPAGGVLIPSDLISIQAIKGTSVTVRTAHINGSKYVQTLLTSNRGANP